MTPIDFPGWTTTTDVPSAIETCAASVSIRRAPCSPFTKRSNTKKTEAALAFLESGFTIPLGFKVTLQYSCMYWGYK